MLLADFWVWKVGVPGAVMDLLAAFPQPATLAQRPQPVPQQQAQAQLVVHLPQPVPQALPR